MQALGTRWSLPSSAALSLQTMPLASPLITTLKTPAGLRNLCSINNCSKSCLQERKTCISNSSHRSHKSSTTWSTTICITSSLLPAPLLLHPLGSLHHPMDICTDPMGKYNPPTGNTRHPMGINRHPMGSNILCLGQDHSLSSYRHSLQAKLRSSILTYSRVKGQIWSRGLTLRCPQGRAKGRSLQTDEGRHQKRRMGRRQCLGG